MRNRIAGVFAALGALGALAVTCVVVTACSAKTSRLSLSPLTGNSLSVNPPSATVALWQTQTFTPSNGTAPYTYSVSGGGTIDTNGNFIAPGTLGTSTITITDANAQTTSVPVTVTLGSHLIPDDPYFSQLWPFTGSLTDLGFTAAWYVAHDCTKVPIGIVDSGVDPNHPDLTANLDLSLGQNFVNTTGGTTDITYHGTHVAGIMGAIGNNGVGVTGVCWTAQLVPLVAVDTTGLYIASAGQSAISYAAQKGIKIVLLSWEDVAAQDSVPSGDQGQFSAVLQAANTAGILVIASAGDGGNSQNGGPGADIDQAANQMYPGSLGQLNPNLITVAAVDQKDQLATYSNFGNQSVQIAAPGDSIGSTLPTYTTSQMTLYNVPQNYGLLSGAAMAAAYVAGAAALTWVTHKSLSPAELKTRILQYADQLPGLTSNVENGRRLNVGRLVTDP